MIYASRYDHDTGNIGILLKLERDRKAMKGKIHSTKSCKKLPLPPFLQ
jgi:hypothetical protein